VGWGTDGEDRTVGMVLNLSNLGMTMTSPYLLNDVCVCVCV
jgi:hypothetical protein